MKPAIAFEGRGTSGPPLLLVHGFPLDRALWRAQLDALGGEARVVALDLPGFGATPAESDGRAPTTMEAYAEQVVAVADALGFVRFALAGLSMGGYVALAVARRHPARLAALALVDTRAEADAPEARPGRLKNADRALSEGTAFLADEMLPKLLAPATLSGRPELVAAARAMVERTSAAGAAAALRGMAERPDARPDLGRIAVPTTVVVGAEDSLTPPELARALATAIPDAELVVAPGAGHLTPIEAPDAVTAALRGLLARLP